MNFKTRLYVVGAALLVRCGQPEVSDSVYTSFIPGTYVKQINQEFARGADTIVISLDDPALKQYNVNRRSFYVQKIDGKSVNTGNKSHLYKGIFDAQKKQLVIRNLERTISFSPERNCLTFGTADYEKVTP